MPETAGPADARLLLADDDPGVLHILGMGLRSAGFKVTLAADGTRAMEALEKERFDLVVLDILMPGATGWEVLQKAHGATPEGQPLPRAILFTGFQQEYVLDLDLLAREGVSTILLKPFPATELIEEIHRALAQDPIYTLPKIPARRAYGS